MLKRFTAAEINVPLIASRFERPPLSDSRIKNSSRVHKPINGKVRAMLSMSSVLVASTLFNAASLAQSPVGWIQCLGLEGPAVDTVIDGCTAVIESGQNSQEELATAFDNRGVAYRLKGEYDRALQDYEQAIRLNPSNANAYNNRGVVYRIKREYALAVSDYDEAIWLKKGDFPAAYYNRALAYADKGEYEKSLRDFDIVIEVNPRSAMALYAGGLTLVRKGDTEAGMAGISAAKAINPNIGEQFDDCESPLR
jgi:tetratricopeptide (TPR) repeat protein